MAVRTRIKVCGITELEYAKAAVDAGVDALGFIFAKKSPRFIEPDKAREIIEKLPPFIDTVGVFVNEDAQAVNEILEYCSLSVAQLHGVETPQYCAGISCQVVKSFQVGPQFDSASLVPYDDIVGAFLLDTYHKDMDGGTGEVFDWKLVENLNVSKPVILAGGLSPDNVGSAIRLVKPHAVDVNSGVETAPGIKDIDAIERLVLEVREADS